MKDSRMSPQGWALAFVLLGIGSLFLAMVVKDHDLRLMIASEAGTQLIGAGLLAFRHSTGLESTPQPQAPILPAPAPPANS